MTTTATCAAAFPYFQSHLDHLTELWQLKLAQRETGQSRTVLAEATRTDVVSWMLELAFKAGVETKAAQLACLFFDRFCEQWNGMVKEFVGAVALTALMVASKVEGSGSLSPDWVSQRSNLSVGNIQELETLMLLVLDWDLDLPTAAEASRLLLTASATAHDFGEVIITSDCYASLCYTSANILRNYSPEAIALASICYAFEQRGQMDFSTLWVESAQRSVSTATVRELCQFIRTQLQKLSASDEETDCGSPVFEA